MTDTATANWRKSTNQNGVEVWSYFSCRCGDKSTIEDANWERARQLFAKDSADMHGAELRPERVLTQLSYSMTIDFQAEIKSILTDQWHRITVAQWRYDESHPDKFVDDFIATVECDRLEDGLVCCWLMLCDRYGRPTEVAGD